MGVKGQRLPSSRLQGMPEVTTKVSGVHLSPVGASKELDSMAGLVDLNDVLTAA